MAYAVSNFIKEDMSKELPGMASPGTNEEERWAAAKAAFSKASWG